MSFMEVEIDEVWKRDEVDSPCVKLCVIHPAARKCIGCFRTTDEIAGWTRMAPDFRRALVEALPEREKLLKTKRKRRARS